MTKGIYKSAVIFSGGGTRIAMYGGMYEALEMINKKPELLIGTCGGAFATTVINAFQSNKERKEYLKSEEFYSFIKNTQLTEQRKLTKIGWLVLKKRFSMDNAPIIEDIFGQYLVEMKQNMEHLFPCLANIRFNSATPTIIIGTKMLFSPSECGQKRNGRKLFKKVLFTDKATADQININEIKVQSDNYRTSAVDDEILIKTDVSMLTAARISVSDMFYVPPVFLDGNYFCGGAIDLVPVELANSIAREVIIEKKQNYTAVEESLLRAVFGFSGNKRLNEIEQFDIKHKIDTQDILSVLKGYYPKKYIDWRNMEIAMSLPKTYEEFAESIERQWKYGYDKIMKTF